MSEGKINELERNSKNKRMNVIGFTNLEVT